MPPARLIRLILLTLALGAGLALSARVARAETRVALVIGNSAYAHGGRLTNPVNDAAVVAQSLRRVGFTVISRNDLDRNELESTLKSFTRASAGADIALVYYAGHGIEKGGTNYLVPIDASLAADSDVDFEAVPLDLVMHAVSGATRLKIVILDACRNNPFRDSMRRSAGTRGIGQGLAKPPDPEEGDMLVAYAAEAGSTAEDGAGANSPFATALARHIPDPGVDIRIMFGKIRDDVRLATHRRQEPAVYESLGGEQFFMASAAGPSGLPAAQAPTAAPDARTMDLAFWQSVEDSNDTGQLNAYLSQYPNGAFAALARRKIEALGRQAAAGGSAGDQGLTRGGAGPGGFDGRWDVTQACPKSPDGAEAYTFEFTVEVKNSQLHGEHGMAGQPGWLSIDGPIKPDGSAKLDAHGRTGHAQFNVAHAAPGMDFHHLVTASFNGARGSGQWVAIRTCQFTFSRE
jgi:uncharacterized caspase-like protein